MSAWGVTECLVAIETSGANDDTLMSPRFAFSPPNGANAMNVRLLFLQHSNRPCRLVTAADAFFAACCANRLNSFYLNSHNLSTTQQNTTTTKICTCTVTILRPTFRQASTCATDALHRPTYRTSPALTISNAACIAAIVFGTIVSFVPWMWCACQRSIGRLPPNASYDVRIWFLTLSGLLLPVIQGSYGYYFDEFQQLSQQSIKPVIQAAALFSAFFVRTIPPFVATNKSLGIPPGYWSKAFAITLWFMCSVKRHWHQQKKKSVPFNIM